MARLPQGFVRRKDGRLQLSFTIEGSRYSVYGQTVKECREKEVVKRQQINEGLQANKNISLQTYFERWQKSRRGVVKDTTICSQEYEFRRVNRIIGKKHLQKLEKADILKVQQKLSETLTTASTNHTIALLKCVLDNAVNDRIISWNPCNGVKPLKRIEPVATDTIHRALEVEEQQLFFQYAKESYYYNFFRFLLMTGCRTGEASALCWSDIDRKENVIRINKTVSRTDANVYDIVEPKTRTSNRKIPLSGDLLEVLNSQREINHALHGNVALFDGRIFPASDGKAYVLSCNLTPIIKGILRRIEKETGTHIEYFSPHALRDTFATRCIEQGMNPQTLKTILGHSSLAMTMDKYAQVLDNVKQQEMQRIRFVI